MKRIDGVNADYMDWDERDPEAAQAEEDYNAGLIGFDDLEVFVGKERAMELQLQRYEESGDPESFFDDPQQL